MPRHIPVLVALTVIGVAVADAGRRLRPNTNRLRSRRAARIGRHASMLPEEHQGRRPRRRGQAVRDVSIVAMGTILAAVRSDARGQFSLALPPGEYLLRATVRGLRVYVSRAVRIQSSAQFQRDITLTRQGVTGASRPVVLPRPARPARLPGLARPHRLSRP